MSNTPFGITAVPSLIKKKRDGSALTAEEVEFLVDGYSRGSIPDYQMSAFAMATCIRGMSIKETTALTLAMRDSGVTTQWGRSAVPRIDKHSTGGVGDKISICLAPLVASCGVHVPMMSGRGLGHTGGTLDKLEAIPGFSVNQSVSRFRALVQKHGFAMIGQTKHVAPADRKLYALRDVTGTVESIPLITASILSKKLAEGIDGLVLDCKVGKGAFMVTKASAKDLARTLTKVGNTAGLKVRAVLTNMNQPLGNMVGNALETMEAIEILHNRGPDDVRELTLVLGRHMLELAGVAKGKAAEQQLVRALHDGSALKRFSKIIRAQGGNPNVTEDYDVFPQAKHRQVVRASAAGYVTAVDALAIGVASMNLGAGRSTAEDPVDPAAGIELTRKVGDQVKKETQIAVLYCNKRERLKTGANEVRRAFTIGSRSKTPEPLIFEVLR